MQKLAQAAQHLRESTQALAQKKQPDPDRDAAIGQAQAALLDTQRAMLELPPEMRSRGSASTPSYDESVKKLMKAADSLRDSIQAMAQLLRITPGDVTRCAPMAAWPRCVFFHHVPTSQGSSALAPRSNGLPERD